MDLRYRPRARTTKDGDLAVSLRSASVAADLRDRLQDAADIDLGDYVTFRIGERKSELTYAPKGGGRFPCEAVMLGKTYARFHIDVGFGDAVAGEPEQLTGDDLLEFASIAACRLSTSCLSKRRQKLPAVVESGIRKAPIAFR